MSNTIALEKKYHFQNYNRFPLEISHGKGARVWDSNGKEYLDFLAGIAVNSLGHCHPKIVEEISKQASKLMHVSNFFYTEPQSKLAEKLCLLSGLDRVMFMNSGAEAMEGAIKLARKYSNDKGKTGKIYSMENAFHGRTIATISLGKAVYKKGFEPIPEGFATIPMHNYEKLNSIKNDAIAVVIEPIQGEGGVRLVNGDYLKYLRKFCSENDILLIFDEVQSGIGRTGKMFSFELYDVQPDILCLAKGLGTGFPVGALLAKENVAKSFGHGNHGSTFGGNPLATAVALKTLEVIEEERVLNNAEKMGVYLKNELIAKFKDNKFVKEIRGIGLFCGVELTIPCRNIVEAMFEKGVLTNCTSQNVIRIIPPLIINKNDIDEFINKLIDVFKENNMFEKKV